MQKLLLSYCIAKNMNVTTDAQLFIKYWVAHKTSPFQMIMAQEIKHVFQC